MAKSLSRLLAVLVSSAAFVAPALASPPPAAELAGDWSGTLPALPPKRVIMHVRVAGDRVQVTLDAPDNGVQGIPVQNLSRDGPKVAFSMPAAAVTFLGELQPGGHELRGVFTDHEIVQPLILAFAASDAPPPPFKVTALEAGKPRAPEQIRQVLKTEVAARQAMGLIVGIIGPDGRTVISEGVADPKDPTPLAADRPLFMEAVVKAFTGLLLADMVQRGEVKLDDPLDAYLPDGVHAPEREGRKITLLDLATHTSGLPRGPNDFQVDAGLVYPVERSHAALARYRLTRDPGSVYEYSDWGSALLGDALARRAGLSFEALIRARITGPLGMTATTTRPTPQMMASLPLEHDSGLRPRLPAPAFDDAWVPAYELYMTVDDLLRFLQSQIVELRGPAAAAASSLARSRRRPIGPLEEASLAWEVHHIGQPSVEVFGVSGGSRSVRAHVAFRPDTHVGVVVYANASTAMNPEDIAMYVLVGRPVPPPPPPPPITAADSVAINLPAEAVGRLVGRYRLTPQMVINITDQGARLFAAKNYDPLTELFPSSPTRFFAKTVNVQVDFDVGPDGRATGLRLKWNGTDMTAPRIADDGVSR